jgi:vacuolar-type H+-ATPase subunit I/STV1
MFRKGGSAEGGITSGLQRPGYNVGERVTEVMDEMKSIRPQRNTAKRRLGDLMIDFGIDIGSRTPTGSGIGGAISTALASAKDPFDRFRQSRAADEGYEDKLALGAYDVVKGEQAEKTKFDREKELIALEAKLNPKNVKGFEFQSKQDALSKLQDGQDVITQQITEIQTMPASPEIDVNANQEQIKQLQRELQKNQQLQKLIAGRS